MLAELKLLKALLSHVDGNAVNDWNVAGGMFLSYIQLVERIPNVLEAANVQEIQGSIIPTIEDVMRLCCRAKTAAWATSVLSLPIPTLLFKCVLVWLK